MSSRPVILALCDYYLPGFRAGGPMRALSGLVEHLGDDFDFRIVTRDNDLGGDPYTNVEADVWQPVGKSQVLYLSSQRRSFDAIRRAFDDTSPDVVYLNSFMSPLMTIRPLVLRRRGRVADIPFIVAPRGELARAALQIKRLKKSLWLSTAKMASLYRDVVWHASSVTEADDIVRVLSPATDVTIAPELPTRLDIDDAPRHKTTGRLKLLFFSRVSPMKNLIGACEMLGPLEGQIDFTICGPMEDASYWQQCQAVIDTLPCNITIDVRNPVAPDKVASLLREHDVFFLPTQGENFGHAIFEALQSGCPVLISDRTPWRGLTSHRAGWDIALDDVDSFRRVLCECVGMDAPTFQSWSDGARQFAGDWLSTSDAMEQNRKLFDSVIHG